MIYVYDVDPVGKVRMTQSDKWKKRPAVVRYRMYADYLRQEGATLGNGDRIKFYIAMPSSWSDKKRSEMCMSPHLGKPDLDNLIGGLMDAIHPTGDSHIWVLGRSSKCWARAGKVVIIRGDLEEE